MPRKSQSSISRQRTRAKANDKKRYTSSIASALDAHGVLPRVSGTPPEAPSLSIPGRTITRKGGTLITRSADILKFLNPASQTVVGQTANSILVRSTAIIAARGGQEGSALGPVSREGDLLNSGYVVTPTNNEGYERAVGEVKGLTASTAKKRRQIADEIHLDAAKDEALAGVSYATTFAGLIHEGHAHGTGVPFLTDAAKEEWEAFLARLKKLLRETERITVPSFSKIGRMQHAHQRALLSHAEAVALHGERYDAYISALETWENSINESSGENFMKPQKWIEGMDATKEMRTPTGGRYRVAAKMSIEEWQSIVIQAVLERGLKFE